MKALSPALLLMMLVLTACSKEAPCAICYEDEWSREPFPGEAKQHMQPLTPEELKANGGKVPDTRKPLTETAE